MRIISVLILAFLMSGLVAVAGITPSPKGRNLYAVVYSGTALEEVIADFNRVVPGVQIVGPPHSHGRPVHVSRPDGVPWDGVLAGILEVHNLTLAADTSNDMPDAPQKRYYIVPFPWAKQPFKTATLAIGSACLLLGLAGGFILGRIRRKKTANTSVEHIHA